MAKTAATSRRSPTPATLRTRLESLARNLYWTWDAEMQQLFAGLEPLLWEACRHNPIRLLQQLGADRMAALVADASFLRRLGACERALRDALRAKAWFPRTHRGKAGRLRVAYFCAEYALHESFPQYSGGLGVLAGDHLKSASDLGIPLVGVGLLYRSGYYVQSFAPDGKTVVGTPAYDFTQFPITDTRKHVRVPIGKRFVKARIWQVQVGRVPLYLLDTDVPANARKDRALTHQLYGGDNELRIQQEILLGVGGLLALDKLAIRPTVFHLNEGHAAFCALERLRRAVRQYKSVEKAAKSVRASTVFTTHTPVPAGHDRFSARMMMRYFPNMPRDLKLARADFLAVGQEHPGRKDDPFCMTVLALNLSAHCNGVSKLHGAVSREMWQGLFAEARTVDEVPIGHVTNGIHTRTWLAAEVRPLYDRYLTPTWVGSSPEDDWWRHADRIPASELWRIRSLLRKRLVHFVRRRIVEQRLRAGAPSSAVGDAYGILDENALTVGFARRFATYKRAPLIFRDPDRLETLLCDPQRPVQLLFAGKAHPADQQGQAFAQAIHEYAEQERFRGRVVLLENYDMEIGRLLTAGCDLWLNNPIRPREASGTSGMKPPLHGGLNCSILDGWWPEAYDGTNGWAIAADEGEAATGEALDRRDAEALYRVLTDEIVPCFYDRDSADVPQRWMEMAKRSMQTVCGQFNTHRMLADYVSRYYLPAHGVNA